MDYFGTRIDDSIVENIYQFADKVTKNEKNSKTDTQIGINSILEKYSITKFSNEEVSLLNALTKVLNSGNTNLIYEVALQISNTNLKIEPYLEKLEHAGDYYSLISIYENNSKLSKSKISKTIQALDNPRLSQELLCRINYKNCTSHLKIIEEKGTPIIWLYLAKYTKNQIDIEKIRNMILSSQDPEANYRMACYISSRYVQKETNGTIQEYYTNHIYEYYKLLYKNDKVKLRALSKEHTDKVAEIKSERYCYKCAMNVKGVDRGPLLEVVANGESAKYMLKYAIDIPNADLNKLRDSIHSTNENEYINIFDEMFPTNNINEVKVSNS